MSKFKAIFGHLKTVFKHKYWVFHYCRLAGIPWRGLVHDLSKFSPTEFIESVKYYQGGKSSPINAAKREQGFSRAWQHHKGRNTHHYEYWTDNYDSGTTCIKMPFEDAVEMICDYLGAARAYWGKEFTYTKELDWWVEKKKVAKIHKHTKAFVSQVLLLLTYYENSKESKNNVLSKNYLKHIYDTIVA